MARVELFNQIIDTGSDRPQQISDTRLELGYAAIDKRVLIVSPHPDDMELFLGHIVQYLLAHGYQIYELLMSWGEMGTRRYPDPSVSLEQKQKCIKTARLYENFNSKKVYTHSVMTKRLKEKPHPIEIIPLHFPDGQIRRTPECLTQIRKILRKMQPTMIIAPDYQYPIDFHPDHLISGKIIHEAAQVFYSHKENAPQLFLYQTIRPTYNRFPMQSWRVWSLALERHKSQFSRFGVAFMKLLSFAYNIVFGQGHIPLRQEFLGHHKSGRLKRMAWLPRLFSRILKFTSKPPMRSTPIDPYYNTNYGFEITKNYN